MAMEPKGRGIAWVMAAHVVCCGGILLVASGAVGLAGITGWLLDGGIIWVAAVILAIVTIYLWRRGVV